MAAGAGDARGEPVLSLEGDSMGGGKFATKSRIAWSGSRSPAALEGDAAAPLRPVRDEGLFGVDGLAAPRLLKVGDETRFLAGELRVCMGEVRPEWIEALAPPALRLENGFVGTETGERSPEGVPLDALFWSGVGGGEGAILDLSTGCFQRSVWPKREEQEEISARPRVFCNLQQFLLTLSDDNVG